ncbi:hypothetical protein [Helicobacter pylori]|uniref:hypothetical protein n=2 Tax=Helicobacter pylori TaxID=210 RepID=UPI000573FD2B|nr:hypothetical protein [Helicobacter pylori]KHL84765.1 hypothetical protein HPY1846_00005 [Helicobacter pylori]MCQ2823751.1 hypothetical protein [Helicobacter pylori]
MFADKQTPTSEALASMDKSASQFESVGVSRSCFCVSKIKQDSANLAPAQAFAKTHAVFRAFCGARSPCLIKTLFN